MDRQTLNFYQQRASEWAAALPAAWSPQLDGFLDLLPPGASIVELGCGDGRDAARMTARGFDAHPSDGSSAMALLASERLGRPVPVMRFNELVAMEAFDAVWCQASLLHLPEDALPGVLSRIHRAVRAGGLHRASYKDGTGGSRDKFGRFFSYLPADRLEAAYRNAGTWAELSIGTHREGSSFGGGPTVWHHVLARK